MRQRRSWFLHHHGKQVEFRTREVNRAAILTDVPAVDIHLQITQSYKLTGRFGRVDAPNNRSDPCEELARFDSRGDVVIGSRFQPIRSAVPAGALVEISV